MNSESLSHKVKGKPRRQLQAELNDANRKIAELTTSLDTANNRIKESELRYAQLKTKNKNKNEQAELANKMASQKIEDLEEKFKFKNEESTDQHLRTKLTNIMKETRVPIVATIVLKTIYERSSSEEPKKERNRANYKDNRPDKIRARQSEFEKFGCENADQVIELADSVSCSSLYLYL